jgi:hypothetical protein
MAKEWQVGLILDGRGGTVKGSHRRDLLRSRFGDDIAVPAEKAHIFVNAGSGKAAEKVRAVMRGDF